MAHNSLDSLSYGRELLRHVMRLETNTRSPLAHARVALTDDGYDSERRSIRIISLVMPKLFTQRRLTRGTDTTPVPSSVSRPRQTAVGTRSVYSGDFDGAGRRVLR